jgi:hypothetical protein
VHELEARVQQLEDDRALRSLLARYGYTADNCDDEGFVNLYTEDGSIKLSNPGAGDVFGGSDFVEWSGRDGVRAFITHPEGHHSPALYGKSMHLHGSNLVTHIDGDEAVADSYGVAIVKNDQGVSLISAGNNQWQFRRVDGKWLIKQRRGASLGDDKFASNLDATPD